MNRVASILPPYDTKDLGWRYMPKPSRDQHYYRTSGMSNVAISHCGLPRVISTLELPIKIECCNYCLIIEQQRMIAYGEEDIGSIDAGIIPELPNQPTTQQE